MSGPVGVLGAGTMGAGIAQLACLAGRETRLHDPDPKALEAGTAEIRKALARGTERGRWSAEDATEAEGRLTAVSGLEQMAGCAIVIEAAPERLELKQELFADLAGICGDATVLATNTSSLSVTAIAGGVPVPERVIGMHFFNPPPLMRLVEVVAGDGSGEPALEAATELADAMGRTPIRVRDGIGFVANRCARPFTLESLRMLGEGVATVEEIDVTCRVGGGFRMGPFELMDLVGIDINFAVAQSFFEQSFGEPRWRPHPLHARMAASGRLGRKTGSGFYTYPGDGSPHRPEDPDSDDERPVMDPERLTELAGPRAPKILERIAACIANEAHFALGEQVASAGDMDTAMRLGFNWPLGPFEWTERLGAGRSLAILSELRDLNGDGYRAAPLLRAEAAV